MDLALVSVLDILRDPRWGRSEECFGEDPVLAAAFAGAVVRGYQSQGVDVTAKHLCAQGETTGGVNASAARIGPRELREIHLPAVRACVEAGAASFMAAYNEIGDCLYAQVVSIRKKLKQGKKLDKSDQAFYRANRELIDMRGRATSAEEDMFDEWTRG